MNSANKVALLAKILVWVPQFRIIRLNKFINSSVKDKAEDIAISIQTTLHAKKINQLFDMV